MKSALIVLISLMITSCTTPNLERFTHHVSDDFELPQYTLDDFENRDLKAKAAFIYTILFNTVELNIHRMNGASGNQIYVHDGGGEAVFDSNGDIVKDCANMGSFNYAHYKSAPLTHFAVDILPWLRWGNCRKSITTKKQRVTAYIKDIKDGFKLSLSGEVYFLPKNFDFSQPGESETIAFFIAALEHSNFDFLNFIMNNQTNPKEQKKFLKALKHGFMYQLTHVYR